MQRTVREEPSVANRNRELDDFVIWKPKTRIGDAYRKPALISEKRGRFAYSYANERRTLRVLQRSHGKNPNVVDTFYTANLSLVATETRCGQQDASSGSLTFTASRVAVQLRRVLFAWHFQTTPIRIPLSTARYAFLSLSGVRRLCRVMGRSLS